VARHADLETASIPTELDFGRYRHPREVTDSMSIETVDARGRGGGAGSTPRHRNPLAADRGATGGWTFLVHLTKRTVVGTSGDPDRLDFVAALRRGTRA